jgi:membrane associated rhomboid family serine protease
MSGWQPPAGGEGANQPPPGHGSSGAPPPGSWPEPTGPYGQQPGPAYGHPQASGDDRPTFMPPEGPPGQPLQPSGPQVCYRHQTREAHIRCQRCGRPICPDCMNPAPVGFQCPDCVREAIATQRQVRTALGGKQRTGPPLVTYGLIAINVFLFLLQQVRPSITDALFQVTGPVYDNGNLIGLAMHEYYRLLTAGFVHGGLLHVGVNMFSLFSVGVPLERALGRLRFAAVYFLSLFGASLFVLLFSAVDVAALGASGAVFGIFGAIVVLTKKLGYDIKYALGILAINVVINVVYSSALSWQGHLGGLLTGALAGVVIGWAPGQGAVRRRNQWIGLGLIAVVVAVSLVLALSRLSGA